MRPSSLSKGLILCLLAFTLTVTACGRRTAPVYRDGNGQTVPTPSFPPPYGPQVIR